MRDHCNARDPTRDIAEEIFDVICIIAIITIWRPPNRVYKERLRNARWTVTEKTQLCSTFAELFDFSLAAESRNGLTFAITHRLHGRAIYSGLPIAQGSILEWEPAACNILLESKTTNFLKHNFESDTYQGIMDMVGDLSKMSTTWADTIATVPQGYTTDTDTVPSAEQIDGLLSEEEKNALSNDVAEALVFERDSEDVRENEDEDNLSDDEGWDKIVQDTAIPAEHPLHDDDYMNEDDEEWDMIMRTAKAVGFICEKERGEILGSK